MAKKETNIRRWLVFRMDNPVTIEFKLGARTLTDIIPPPGLAEIDGTLTTYTVDIEQPAWKARRWDADFCDEHFVQPGYAEWAKGRSWTTTKAESKTTK